MVESCEMICGMVCGLMFRNQFRKKLLTFVPKSTYIYIQLINAST